MSKSQSLTTNQQPPTAADWNYPIAQILTLRNELAQILTADFSGKTVTGESFDKFVRIIQAALPGALDYDVLRNSVQSSANVVLTPPALKTLAWRLAGNLPRLRRHRVVTQWSSQPFSEWVPIQIMDVARERNKAKQVGGLFTKFWSLRCCQYMARLFRFSKRTGSRSKVVPKFPFLAVEQLVTMRFYALMEPALCREGKPGFEKMKVPASMGDWNLEQLRFRFRVDRDHRCPERHPQSFQCHNCPLSYYQCRAGTHSRPWTERPCPQCVL